MIYLVVGTQNSGKSALAEDLAMNTQDVVRVYLATMKIYDDAGKERVQKHRKQREGKGFETLEQEYNISNVIDKIRNPRETTVLLECVSNLVGNELYENRSRMGISHYIGTGSEALDRRNKLAEGIAGEIRALATSVHNTVIVTNEYPQEDKGYDEETRVYVQLLSMVNDRIKEFSDKIYDLRKERTN